MTSYHILKTTDLGDLLLVAADGKLTGIYFHDCKHAPKPRPDWRLEPTHPVLKQAEAELREYLAGRRKSFSTPLHPAGTDFQGEVWRQIAGIPYGKTITYTELARRVGKPAAVRAAGTATGRNPLSVVIPCHRVVGKGGSMRGYAGGLNRKQRLLEMESVAAKS
jgi:methylated-DNA-[protein]-cysteine S-methyltransferase